MTLIRPMAPNDIPGAVGLQKACFPDPFPENLLWSAEHLVRHIKLFPEGQFVAEREGIIVASASSTLISEVDYQAHGSWDSTVGGPFLKTFDPNGTTLYGLDISVHPGFRGKGLARELYDQRFDLVRRLRLVRYATACRLPDFSRSGLDLDTYLGDVRAGVRTDRTLTPLLRMGLTLIGGANDYMEDEESSNCAALLEWLP